MALVVEDGTGKADANTYVDAATAAARIAELYPSAPFLALSPTSKQEALLLRAERYLATTYRGKWDAARTSATQALDWPRTGVVDADGYLIAADQVPDQVVEAQVEAARLLANGVNLDGSLDRGGAVKATKLGPLEVEYFEGAPGGATTPTLDAMLVGLVTGGGSSAMQVRTGRG